MHARHRICRPDDAALDELCRQLAELGPALDADNAWPSRQLELCGEYGVFEWFLPTSVGGQGWSDADVVRGYLRLSAACLTTAFIITQRTGACRRIAIADNQWARDQCLPELTRGRRFATVGISHLTTSRRHWDRPALLASEIESGFLLQGFSPWVTGARHADWVVIGAALIDGRQILAAVPTDLPGVIPEQPVQLIGLSASDTGPVKFERAEVPRQWLLAGPMENVMKSGVGARSGGLQTSTLAAGSAGAAIQYLEEESQHRPELTSPADSLRDEWASLCGDLIDVAEGNIVCSNEQLRTRANSLALRASQAALTAAKGAGYIVGHPAGRWCREALFFLVWSCPPPVMQANLCELAGINS